MAYYPDLALTFGHGLPSSIRKREPHDCGFPLAHMAQENVERLSLYLDIRALFFFSLGRWQLCYSFVFVIFFNSFSRSLPFLFAFSYGKKYHDGY